MRALGPRRRRALANPRPRPPVQLIENPKHQVGVVLFGTRGAVRPVAVRLRTVLS